MSLVVISNGCVPVTGGDHDETVFSVTITTAATELKTLEETSFIVEIEDEMGNHMTDMSGLNLEIRTPGGEWSEISLMVMDGHYMGTHTFNSSGDYEIRVLGMAHMGDVMEQMNLMDIHVERAHVDAGPYHVQFESNPGHIDAGEEVMLMFWVALEDGGNTVVGLTPQIIAEEADGHETNLSADEVEPGVYHAMMNFLDAGELHVQIVIVDENGQEFAADFHFHISEAH